MELKPLYDANPEFSTEKNNLIADINRLYEVVSSSEKFKTNYDDIIHVIDALNSRMAQYTDAGKGTVKCDIADMVYATIDFNKLAEELKTKIRAKTKPLVGTQWIPIEQSISDITPIDTYQQDELEDMRLNLPQERKKAKKFLDAQHRAINYMKQYVSDFDFFEKSLQRRRESIVGTMTNNIPYIVNEHYKIVYKAITDKASKLPEFVEIDGVQIPFKNKQKEFIKEAIVKLCENL